jgi:hypothetical protein
MTEANKNTIKDLAKIFGGMGALVTLMLVIPQGSFGQKVLGFLMLSALLGSIIWFTPLGNPIKKLIRKSQDKKGK